MTFYRPALAKFLEVAGLWWCVNHPVRAIETFGITIVIEFEPLT